MKKCPFCGKELSESADFCPFCMSLLKEKTPVTIKNKKSYYKKIIISGIALCVAVIIGLITVGNINDKSGIVKPQKGSSVTSIDSEKESTDTKVEDNQAVDGGLNSNPTTGENAKPQTPTGNGGGEINSGSNDGVIDDNLSNNGNTGNKGDDTEEENQNNTGSDSNDEDNDDLIYENLRYIIEPEYYGSNNMVAIITGPAEDISGELIIPNAINGYKVDDIRKKAFKDCKNITSLVISKGIRSIDDSVFENCTSLRKVEIKAAYTILGTNMFKNCTALKEVYMESQLDISYNMFEGCTALEDITIKTNDIGNEAFKNCTNLKRVTIISPYLSPTHIKENAFYGCASLEKALVYEDISKMVIFEGNDYFKKVLTN